MSIYGIDFGHSAACIAKIESDGNPYMIYNYADGTSKLECAIYFEGSNNVIIGTMAKEMLFIDNEPGIMFPKLSIRNPISCNYEFYGHIYSPVEVCAMILKKLKDMVEEQGNDISDVVVALPSYFGVTEKKQ